MEHPFPFAVLKYFFRVLLTCIFALSSFFIIQREVISINRICSLALKTCFWNNDHGWSCMERKHQMYVKRSRNKRHRRLNNITITIGDFHPGRFLYFHLISFSNHVSSCFYCKVKKNERNNLLAPKTKRKRNILCT